MSAPQARDNFDSDDVFVSYSRQDNQQGQVTAFVEELTSLLKAISLPRPIHVFFDTGSIRLTENWNEQLTQAIRKSRFLLVLVSPAYFASDWCYREWDIFRRMEGERDHAEVGVAPIFLVSRKDTEDQLPEAKRLWWNEIVRHQGLELHGIWPREIDGSRNLQIKEKLQVLAASLANGVNLSRRLATVPRNLHWHGHLFVGREAELQQLRTQLFRSNRGGICGITGVAGIGKSSLAREFAWKNRANYLGGQFEIDLATVRKPEQLQAQFVSLARNHFRTEISTDLAFDEQVKQAFAVFENRDENTKVLIILDNLDEDAVELVSQRQLARMPTPGKVHLLITTQAEKRQLGGIDTVDLDRLEPGEGLDLLARYRQFLHSGDDAEYQLARASSVVREYTTWPEEQEWKAALSIVNRLGGHALAITLVAAYLGNYPDLSYGTFLREMRSLGIGAALTEINTNELVRQRVSHPQDLINSLYERLVKRLSPLAMRVLEYAAWLSPDLVPLAWLRELVGNDEEMHSHLQRSGLKAAPWEETLRHLSGLGYLRGEHYARMHRVLAEAVRQKMPLERRRLCEERVLHYVEQRTHANRNETILYQSGQEIRAAELYVLEQQHQPTPHLGRIAIWLVNILLAVGRLKAACELAELAEQILEKAVHDAPDSTACRYHYSIALERRGDMFRALQDHVNARRSYEKVIEKRRELCRLDPSFEMRRAFAIALGRLGQSLCDSGENVDARRAYQEQYEIFCVLQAESITPQQSRIDIVLALRGVACTYTQDGEAKLMLDYLEEVLRILLENLSEEDRSSSVIQGVLTLVYSALGGACLWVGDLDAARTHYNKRLETARELADRDRVSAAKAREHGLAEFTLFEIEKQAGNLSLAQNHLRCFVEIWTQLHKEDRLNYAEDVVALERCRGDLQQMQPQPV